MPGRIDPYRAFRFRIEVDALESGGFQTVGGLTRETSIDSYREGGINHYEHQHIGRTTYPPLSLKRGLTDPRLWDWHQDVIDGTIVRKTISVLLLDEAGSEVWRWVCADAFPSKWTGAELDAQQSAIMTETIEFVHRGLRRQ